MRLHQNRRPRLSISCQTICRPREQHNKHCSCVRCSEKRYAHDDGTLRSVKDIRVEVSGGDGRGSLGSCEAIGMRVMKGQ